MRVHTILIILKIIIAHRVINNLIVYSTLKQITGFLLDERSTINPKSYPPGVPITFLSEVETKFSEINRLWKATIKHPKTSERFPKLTRKLSKISEVDPKLTGRILKVSEVQPKSFEDFRHWTKNFKGF